MLILVSTLASAYAQTPSQHYTQTNLVSDQPGIAAVTDPKLVNAWGLSRSSTSPWWFADNGTGLATLYTGTGTIAPLVVTIPPSDPTSGSGTPTGTIFNGSPGFEIKPDFLRSFFLELRTEQFPDGTRRLTPRTR